MQPKRKPRLSDALWWAFFAVAFPDAMVVVPDKKVCNPKVPSEACDERLAAVRSGEMVPDKNIGAWGFAHDPRRRITVDMAISGLYEHDFDPYSWYVCPWCGHELPSVYSLRPIDCEGAE